MKRLAVAALLAGAALAGCTSAGSTVPPPAASSAPSSSLPASSPPLTSVHNPNQVTGSLAGKHRMIRGTAPDALPDPACTPEEEE